MANVLFLRKGTITEYVPRGSPHSDGRHWRDFPTLPITEFLEECKQKYMQLEWIPEPGRNGNVALAGATKDEELEVSQIQCTYCLLSLAEKLWVLSIWGFSNVSHRNCVRSIARMVGLRIFGGTTAVKCSLTELKRSQEE